MHSRHGDLTLLSRFTPCTHDAFLLSYAGTAWGDLRDEMPEIAGAEEKAWAKMAYELIYKYRATLNRNYPPKPGLGPLGLLCLLTPSLNPPCYRSPPPQMRPGWSHPPLNVSPRWAWESLTKCGGSSILLNQSSCATVALDNKWGINGQWWWSWWVSTGGNCLLRKVDS